MDDQGLPVSTGESEFPPPQLDPKQDELCKKLDDLHAQSNLKAKPSDMFRGAIFTLSPTLKKNPDWVAQAANSLREILYPLWSRVSTVPERKEEALKKYGSVRVSDALIEEVDVVYGVLNDLTHHGCDPRVLGSHPKWLKDFEAFTIEDFEILLNDFQRIMFEALARQVDIHDEIDDVLATPPTL